MDHQTPIEVQEGKERIIVHRTPLQTPSVDLIGIPSQEVRSLLVQFPARYPTHAHERGIVLGRVEFLDVEKNAGVEEAAFAFQVPEGVQVLEMGAAEGGRP